MPSSLRSGHAADRSSFTPRSRVATSVPGSSARSANAVSARCRLCRPSHPGGGSGPGKHRLGARQAAWRYAAGRPLSIAEVRTAVAGDEAAGLYDTLGELLGPTPAKGAESIDRLLSEGRAGQYLLAILAGQIRDLVLTQAYVQATRVGRRPGGGARKTGLAGRSPQPSGPKRLSGARRRLACGAARRRSKAQDRRDRRDRRAPPRGPAGRCGADGRARPASPLNRARRPGGVIWLLDALAAGLAAAAAFGAAVFAAVALRGRGLAGGLGGRLRGAPRAPAASHCVPWRRRPPRNEPRLPRRPRRRSRVERPSTPAATYAGEHCSGAARPSPPRDRARGWPRATRRRRWRRPLRAARDAP